MTTMPIFIPRPDVAVRYADIATRAERVALRIAVQDGAFALLDAPRPEWVIWCDIADAATALCDEYLSPPDIPRPSFRATPAPHRFPRPLGATPLA